MQDVHSRAYGLAHSEIFVELLRSLTRLGFLTDNGVLTILANAERTLASKGTEVAAAAAEHVKLISEAASGPIVAITEPIDLMPVDKAKLLGRIGAVEEERDHARKGRDNYRALLGSSEARIEALMKLLREAATLIDDGTDAGRDLRTRIGVATAESVKAETDHVETLKAVLDLFTAPPKQTGKADRLT